MADLKHCAHMADSKCHHPIELLYPEYANDRYAIQRDARSIGFLFLGSSVPSRFPFVSLSIPHRYDCDAIPTGVTAKK